MHSTSADVSLDLLRTFLETHRAKSINRAAQHRGISQSAATLHIRRLEKQLKCQLFIRSPQGVAPTDAAITLVERIHVHIDALAEICSATRINNMEPVFGEGNR